MKKIPIGQAILVFLVWCFFTFLYKYVVGGTHTETTLKELVSHALSTNILLAALTTLVFVYLKKSNIRVGLGNVGNWRSWILIYPVLVILIVLFNTASLGTYSNPDNFLWILINTLFVGISEEMMFRGILFSAFVSRHGFVKAAIVVSVLFGAIHALNGFTTGDFVASGMQAVLAGFSGLLFLAIRVKTKSIVPAIIVHWFWDFVSFTSEGSVQGITEDPGAPNYLLLVVNLLMVISPIIFGILGLIQLSKKKTVAEFMETQVGSAS